MLQDGHLVIVTSAKTSVCHNKTLRPVSRGVSRGVVSGCLIWTDLEDEPPGKAMPSLEYLKNARKVEIMGASNYQWE